LQLEYKRHVFLCRVDLGDGQEVLALVDTGSGNLVVPSDACTSAGCRGHGRFRPQDDSEGHFLGVEVSDLSLSYASGRLGGSGFETLVCLAGACGRGRLIVAAFESDEFRRYPFDAILGLGMPRQAVGEGFNLIGELARQGTLPSPSFALALRADGPSSLTLAPDEAVMRAAGVAPRDLTWFAVDSRHGEWALEMSGVAVDGERIAEACSGKGGCRAILDSGTSGIVLPGPLARAVHRRIRGLSDCSTTALHQLPTLSFAFGKRSFEVEPASYVEVSAVDPSHCRILVQPMDGDDSITRTAILGQAFLLGRYVVFNQSSAKVGLVAYRRPLAPSSESAA